MHGVERVREAEPGAVVLRRERPRVAVAPPFRSQPDERRASSPACRRPPCARPARPPTGISPSAPARATARPRCCRSRSPASSCGKSSAGPQVDAEQVPDRVVVFRAIQPPRGDAARIGRREPVDPRELAREPCRPRPAAGARPAAARRRAASRDRAASRRPRPSDRDGRSASSTDVKASKLRSFLCFSLPWHGTQLAARNGLTMRLESLGRGGVQDGGAAGCGWRGVPAAFWARPSTAVQTSNPPTRSGRMYPGLWPIRG